MNNVTLVDDLLLRLEPEWGSQKIESLKLIYQLGDDERKQRIEKIIESNIPSQLGCFKGRKIKALKKLPPLFFIFFKREINLFRNYLIKQCIINYTNIKSIRVYLYY